MASEPVVFEKEMAITHRDFLRLLRRALGGRELAVRDGAVTLDEGGRRLEIALAPESERRIGALALPVTAVRFRYTGYADPARHLARLERSFQRGGG